MGFDRTYRRRRASPLTAGALVLVLLLSTTAQAARMTTVVHGVGAGSDKAAALTGHYVRDLLSRDERYEVVDLGKALGNQDRDKALKAFQAAEELVQKGRDAYDTLDLDAAVEYLTNTLAKYERFAAYVGDFRKVAEALMLLGATHILRGEEKLGSRRLEQAINVYPQIEPDPRIFNPAMRSLFQESVSRANTRPPGTLSITSNPSYAEVYVDGKFAGVTPLAVEKVSEGRHYVRLEKDGYRAWGKVEDVSGRSETAESALLRPTSHYDDFENLVETAIKHLTTPQDGAKGGPGNDAIDQLGVLTNADHIFLAQVRLDGERVQVWANQYDLNAQRLLRAAEHVFTYDGRPEVYEREVASMLRNTFGADVVAPGITPATSKPSKREKPAKGAKPEEDTPSPGDDTLAHAGQARCIFGASCQSVKSGIVIGGLVGGGVFLAGGIALWIEAKLTHDKWAALTQIEAASAAPGSDGYNLYRQGHGFALAGDIAGGLGIAAMVAGLATYIWWDPAPTTTDVLDDTHGAEKPRAFWGATPLPGGGFFSATLPF